MTNNCTDFMAISFRFYGKIVRRATSDAVSHNLAFFAYFKTSILRVARNDPAWSV